MYCVVKLNNKAKKSKWMNSCRKGMRLAGVFFDQRLEFFFTRSD